MGNQAERNDCSTGLPYSFHSMELASEANHGSELELKGPMLWEGSLSLSPGYPMNPKSVQELWTLGLVVHQEPPGHAG